jgi:hypothetical protein
MVLDFGILNSGLFEESDAAGEGLGAPIVNQIIWKDVGVGIVPIGSVIAWCKSLIAGVPPLLPNFVECNGQVLADGDSPLNGATIPNLNGSNYFLRGNATSGGTGGSTSHTHAVSGNTGNSSNYITAPNTGGYYAPPGVHNHSVSITSGGGDGTPPYYNMVWVMRIK